MGLAAVASVVTIGLASTVLLSIHAENIQEKREAALAKDIVENASYLQKISSESDIKSRGYLLNTNRIPISSMIVKDHEHTEHEINAFSKFYAATLKLLNDSPNLTDSQLTCPLLVATDLISSEECELVKDKKFKMYKVGSNSVSYEIASNSPKVAQYAEKIQSNKINVQGQDLDIVQGEENKLIFSIPSAFKQTNDSLMAHFEKDMETRKEIEEYVYKNKISQASAKLKAMGEYSNNKELLAETTKLIANKILSLEVENATSTSPVVLENDLEIAKANLINGISSILHRESIEDDVALQVQSEKSYKELIIDDHVIEEVVGFDLRTNAYLNAYTAEKFTTHFITR